MLVALVSGGWAIAWAAACLLIVSEPLGRADAIVVLSGSSAFEERARLAATLYKEGRAPMIILTNDNQQGGWSPTLQRNLFYWERAVNFLQIWSAAGECRAIDSASRQYLRRGYVVEALLPNARLALGCGSNVCVSFPKSAVDAAPCP